MITIKVLAAASLVCFLITFDITIFFSKTYFQLFWWKKDLIKIFQIIDFFNGSDVIFLNESEISHLNDVKNILNVLTILRDVSLAVFSFSFAFLYVNGKKMELRYVFVPLLILIILCLFLTLLFDEFFIEFHKILFSHGNWEFPASSEMIRLFPRDFWFAVFIHFIILLFSEAVVVFVLMKMQGLGFEPRNRLTD
jgi:integral membrane protein (TIGR01906 family)